MRRYILFDFDGVIVQTEVLIMHKQEELYRACGITFSKHDLSKLMGSNHETRPRILEELFGDQEAYRSHVNEVNAFSGRDVSKNTGFLKLKTEGTDETLKKLEEMGCTICICSNRDLQSLKEAVEEIGIKAYIDGYFSARGTGHCKPDPYIYNLAMESLHCRKEECVAVEDSKGGIEAGKRAGCKVIALKDPDQIADQSEADCIIEKMQELVPVLQQWNREEA